MISNALEIYFLNCIPERLYWLILSPKTLNSLSSVLSLISIANLIHEKKTDLFLKLYYVKLKKYTKWYMQYHLNDVKLCLEKKWMEGNTWKCFTLGGRYCSFHITILITIYLLIIQKLPCFRKHANLRAVSLILKTPQSFIVPFIEEHD